MSDQLKIAVFHNLPSGGAKRALYGFVKYLTNKGHKIDVYIPETANENFLPLNSVGATIYTFNIKNTMKGAINSRRHRPLRSEKITLFDLEETEKEIAKTINEKDYDIVLCEQDQFTMAPFFLKYIKKTTVYYCQQPLRKNEIISKAAYEKLEEPKKSLFGRFFNYIDQRSEEIDMNIDAENAQKADYILANSYFSRESILRAYGLNSYVSYLGIDTNIFRPLDISQENFVLSVGSCNPLKGYDFIIRSLALIPSEMRPKFFIVSNSSDQVWEDYLTVMAQECHVELQIMNLIDDDKLIELYNQAKLVVYAPYLEPFGLVPIEAMGCGTPVVGVKEGGVRETVINGETGILTQRDEKSFADAVQNLLLDNESYHEMSQRSVEVVRNYWTLDHAGRRLEDHINKAVSLKTSQR